MNLFTRLVLFGLLPLLLASAAVSVISYTVYSEQMHMLAAEKAVASGEEQAIGLRLRLQRLVTQWETIARAPDVRMSPNLAFGHFASVREALPALHAEDEFSAMQAMVEEVFVADVHGEAVDSTGNRFNAARFDFWEVLSRGETVVSEVVMPRSGGRRRLMIGVPVFDALNVQQGGLIAAVPVSRLANDLLEAGRQVEARLILLDSSGAIIGTGGAAHQFPQIAIPRENIDMASRWGTLQIEGEDYLYSREALSPSAWNLMLLRPLAEITAPAAKLRSLSLALLLGALAMSLISAWMLHRGTVLPIRQVLDLHRRIGKGEFDARLHVRGRGEIAELGESANRLAAALAEHARETLAAQNATQLAERRKRALLDAMNEGVLLRGETGSVLYANPAACRIVGQSATELREYGLARPGYPLVREDGSPLSFEDWPSLRTLRSGEQVLGMTIGRVSPDGGVLWLLLNTLAFPMENGAQGALVTFIDITYRRQAEEEIVRLNHDLERRVDERTAHLEAARRDMESFAYSVSHDLRAPLRAINGFAHVLADSAAINASGESRALLERIVVNSNRMSQLIDDILAFTRASHLQLREDHVDLAQLVRGVAAELLAAHPHATLDIGPLPVVRGDKSAFKQVFENLLGNAFKYSGKRPHPHIEVGATAIDEQAVIHVRDNGTGFDMRYAGKLFGMFQRLHNERDFSGTGVGLAIVKRFVERHGGRIWAEAEPGRGACFYVVLPQHGQAGAVPAQTQTASKPSPALLTA